jgi:hypothetical protein
MGLKAAIDLDQICVRLRRSRSGSYRLRKATLEPPLRYLKQQESSNARHLIAQAIIDCADKGIREPDEKRRCAYEDPDRLNRREA